VVCIPSTSRATTPTVTTPTGPQPLSKAAYEAKLGPLLNDQVVPALRTALANGGARDPQKLQSAISALDEARNAMASVTPPPAIADLNQQAVTVLGALATDLSNMRAALLASRKSAYTSAARSAVQDALKMQNVGNQMTARGF
jgi:hypothetical protein